MKVYFCKKTLIALGLAALHPAFAVAAQTREENFEPSEARPVAYGRSSRNANAPTFPNDSTVSATPELSISSRPVDKTASANHGEAAAPELNAQPRFKNDRSANLRP